MTDDAPSWTRHLRPALAGLSVYHAPASTAFARMHANENPEPWPDEVMQALAQCVQQVELGRYPDSSGRMVREVLATRHGCDADRIVRLVESKLPEFPRFSVSPGNFSSWQAEAKSYDAMAAYSGGSYNLTGRDQPLRLRGMTVTPRFFEVLGVPAATGRAIAESDAPGDAEPVVLSHRAWMTQVLRRGAMCAFNHDGACSIYPVRPAICRKVHALFTSEFCITEDRGSAQYQHPETERLYDDQRPMRIAIHKVIRPDHRLDLVCSAVARLLGI